MGLEESPHCPFGVMEACRTGVRRDSHQPGWKNRSVVAAAGVMVVQRRRWIGMVLMMGAAMNHQSLTAGGSGRELRKGIGNGGVEGLGRTLDSIDDIPCGGLSGLQEVASSTAARRRRRQAFARPLVGPPNTLLVLSAPGWWICLY